VDLIFERGIGSYLYNDQGVAYLDLLSGIAVNSFGNCHPRLVEALTEQASKLWHVSNLFRIPEAERLSERLTKLCFADRVFFANSGAEAVEAGIKSMRRYQFEQGKPQRNRIIAFHGSFHGRTTATIAASGNPLHIRGFLPNDLGFTQAAWEDLSAVRELMSDEIAGIIVEPVRGEGGVTPASQEFMLGLREICDTSGALLMLDEVQCGIGRTGEFFAHQRYGITPDVMALAKGLGGGFPIGACLTTAQVGDVMQPGSHGTTFGGNPLATSVANAVLDLLTEPDLLRHVTARGDQLSKILEELCLNFPDLFSVVSGAGLMKGLTCKVENSQFSKACLEQGVVVGKAGGNMTRFLPPLNISEAELAEGSEKLHKAAASL
jgi:acetylornithine/N-succinyldiaminopimelate aminotransferase